ncbi:hypothetical protein BCR42DRAFT_425314 [Absidia repens]|uniref:Glycerophosphocholine acyltransferase 1 n=1 Tax=Absidia repens TaxID=90262 RepID=A0A1X2I487_9FUNG|nr:hypothetical protein BCR42DRAFT_425314 [Absidia repens]
MYERSPWWTFICYPSTWSLLYCLFYPNLNISHYATVILLSLMLPLLRLLHRLTTILAFLYQLPLPWNFTGQIFQKQP